MFKKPNFFGKEEVFAASGDEVKGAEGVVKKTRLEIWKGYAMKAIEFVTGKSVSSDELFDLMQECKEKTSEDKTSENEASESDTSESDAERHIDPFF